MATCGFGEWRDLSSLEILYNLVRNSCCCYVCNYLHKQVTVHRQRAKVIPMFRAHAKWSWFTESWHFEKCGGDVLSHF